MSYNICALTVKRLTGEGNFMRAVKTTVLPDAPVLGQEQPFLNGAAHHEPTEELGPVPP